MKAEYLTQESGTETKVMLTFQNPLELAAYHALLGYDQTIPELVFRTKEVRVPGYTQDEASMLLHRFLNEVSCETFKAIQASRGPKAA